MIVVYDSKMMYCPFCMKDGGIQRMTSVRHEAKRTEKYCRYHGQVTGIDHYEPDPAPQPGRY